MNSITKLPSDCVYSVLDFLDLKDILNTRMCHSHLNTVVKAYLSLWIDLVERRFAFTREITTKLSLAVLVRDRNLLKADEELLIAEILKHSTNLYLLLFACQQFRRFELRRSLLARPFRIFVEASFAPGIEAINTFFGCEHHFQTFNILWNFRNHVRDVEGELQLLSNHIYTEVVQLVQSSTMLAAQSFAHDAVNQVKDLIWQYKMYPMFIFISYLIISVM